MLTPVDDFPLSEDAHLEVRVNTKESTDSASKDASERKGTSNRKSIT